MLPVVDKPAIQYVVEEAAAAGLDDVLMITGRHKRAIEDHFDHAFELEQALAAKGDTVRLDAVRDPARLAISTTSARANRSASATWCCAPVGTSAPSRSPFRSATTSSTRARHCSAGCSTSATRTAGASSR
jgi:hypothetical protein